MGLYEVSMVCQMEFEEFVGKDAGLWEAAHTFSDIHVDITINGLFAQSVILMISLGISCSGTFMYLYGMVHANVDQNPLFCDKIKSFLGDQQ